MSGLSIVGSSRSNGNREENDFYPTPSCVTEALLDRENFVGITKEPACGDGAISRVLESRGLDVISTDLIYRGFGEGGVDFLENNWLYDQRCNNIVTNPPFKYALDFVNKSKKIADKKIAMFLKTVFLESSDRYDMFHDKEFPLKVMYQFSKRVSLYKNGVKMKNSGMISFAWFVWEKEYTGEPMIKWIK